MTDRIEQSVTLSAPVARVWRALTDPAEFGAWFGAKLGGRFAVGDETSGPITYPGMEHVVMTVRVTAIEPETRFAFAWHPYAIDPAVDYSAEPETEVVFTVAAVPEGTRLTVVETGFAALPPHRRADALRMNTGGWAAQLKAIAAYVGG